MRLLGMGLGPPEAEPEARIKVWVANLGEGKITQAADSRSETRKVRQTISEGSSVQRGAVARSGA